MLRNMLGGLLALAAALSLPTMAHARLQCVAYARQVSAVQISGNARDWWNNAAGVYERGQQPSAGAVLAFRGTNAMPFGHVAVVRQVVDARHIILDHANWSRPGMVERGVVAVDVSAAGDWSSVRVWHSPSHSLGLRQSPTFGFIYPAAPAVSGGASTLAR